MATFRFEVGRGDWIRTSDPLRPRQVRYQAALRPDNLIIVPGLHVRRNHGPEADLDLPGEPNPPPLRLSRQLGVSCRVVPASSPFC